MTELFNLTDKCALLTGATAGMGLAMAKTLGQAGAKVIICGIDKNETQSTVQELKSLGIDVYGLTYDVGVKSQVEQLYHDALGHLGKIDILICNAGGAPPPCSLTEISDET